MARIEDEYADVLQNIEFGIVATYRQHPEMSDYDAMRMLEALMDIYKAEKIGRAPRNFGLSDVERLCMDAVQRMCEWRLDRAGLPDGAPWSAVRRWSIVRWTRSFCVSRGCSSPRSAGTKMAGARAISSS